MKGKVIYVDFVYTNRKVGYVKHKLFSLAFSLISRIKSLLMKDTSLSLTIIKVKKVQ